MDPVVFNSLLPKVVWGNYKLRTRTKQGCWLITYKGCWLWRFRHTGISASVPSSVMNQGSEPKSWLHLSRLKRCMPQSEQWTRLAPLGPMGSAPVSKPLQPGTLLHPRYKRSWIMPSRNDGPTCQDFSWLSTLWWRERWLGCKPFECKAQRRDGLDLGLPAGLWPE